MHISQMYSLFNNEVNLRCSTRHNKGSVMIPINILPPELSTHAGSKTISPKTNDRTATALSQRKIDVAIMPCFPLSNLRHQKL